MNPSESMDWLPSNWSDLLGQVAPGMAQRWYEVAGNSMLDRLDGEAGAMAHTLLVSTNPGSLTRVYNQLVGWGALVVTDEAVRSLGVFTLVTLGPDGSEVSEAVLGSTGLILMCVSANADLSDAEVECLARFRARNTPVLVLVGLEAHADRSQREAMVKQLEAQTACKVLAINLEQSSARDRLLDEMTKVCPDIEVSLAGEIAALRHRAAIRLVARAAIAAAAHSVDPDLVGDMGGLVHLQMRMLRRLAAIYGHKGRLFGRPIDSMLPFGLKLGLSLGMARIEQARWMKAQHRAVYARNGLAVGSTLALGRAAILTFEHGWPRPPFARKDRDVDGPSSDADIKKD